VLQGDNAVIMSQLQGDFKVKKENLKKLYWSTVHLKEQFDQFEVQTITSTENSRAKSLASRAVATKKTQGFEGMDLKGDKHHQYVNGTPSLTSQAPPKAQSIDDGMHTLSPIIPSKQYLLRFDGGSRGNPGISGSGMVIYDDHQQEVWCGWKFLDGRSTNNEAEYTALLVGLQCALSLGIRKLRVQGDSELIVRQLEGRYQVKDERLKELYNETKALVTRFDEIEIRHIPRAMNKRADELANQAMDSRESFGFHVIDA
jgi:ribonuclease HI